MKFKIPRYKGFKVGIFWISPIKQTFCHDLALLIDVTMSRIVHYNVAMSRQNLSWGFLTRSCTNQAVQALNMATGLKFWIKEGKGLFYLCL